MSISDFLQKVRNSAYHFEFRDGVSFHLIYSEDVSLSLPTRLYISDLICVECIQEWAICIPYTLSLDILGMLLQFL